MKAMWSISDLRKVLYAVAAIVVFGIGTSAAIAQTSSSSLDKVLTQMDAAATKFHSAQASFQWDQFEKVIGATDTQTGTVYFKRAGNSTRAAITVETADGQPSRKYIVYSDGELKFFQPEIDQMTVIKAGNRQGDYESYMTLGFGGSGSELKKNWNVTYQGTEAIDDVQTAKLDLVGKTDAVREKFSHITIWIDPTRAVSLKQVLFEPSGDTRTAYYRNIQYNKPVADSVFKIKTDSKTQVVQK